MINSKKYGTQRYNSKSSTQTRVSQPGTFGSLRGPQSVNQGVTSVRFIYGN